MTRVGFMGQPEDAGVTARAQIERAIRGVEREQLAGIALGLGIVGAAAWREGHSFSTGPEALLGGILAVLLVLYAQVCAFRIDRLRRELRALSLSA